jgi:hypothetical protein
MVDAARIIFRAPGHGPAIRCRIGARSISLCSADGAGRSSPAAVAVPVTDLIGALLPIEARADCGGAVDNNRRDCVNKFALILAWRPVQSVEDEITESDAKTAKRIPGVEKDPPGTIRQLTIRGR